MMTSPQETELQMKISLQETELQFWKVVAENWRRRAMIYAWVGIAQAAVFCALILWALYSPHATAEPAGPPGPGVYPDADLTPGAVDPEATTQKLCTPGYTASVRAVTLTERKEVFRRYQIDWGRHAGYEVDHFVSLELGGSNALENLWPEPYQGVPYTAREKDQVEDYLHRQMCKGVLTLGEVRTMIKEDWVAVYLRCCQGKGGK